MDDSGRRKLTRVWFLRLVFPFACGRLLTGLLLLLLLVPVFYLGVEEGQGGNTPALFFGVIIAYMIPMVSFITERSREALLALRPSLDLDDATFAEALSRMDSVRLRNALFQVACGVLAGLAHMSFMRGSVQLAFHELMSNRTALVSTLGAVLVWVVMTTTISLLIQQAIVLARLGANAVRISLLHVGKLVPFGRVATIASLAMIGALALFPLMSVNSDVTLRTILPGAIATLVPALVLFIIPVWPVHSRIAALKEWELASLDSRIEASLDGGDGTALDAAQLQKIAPLLDYRREIARVPTWPFDASSVTRLALYLVIPPLTWAGAALIENLVDSLL